jgi:nucleoside-diphosphate-sugar epimerase
VVFGAGYLGAEVALRVVAAGAEVVALTRNPTRAMQLAAAGARPVVADLAAIDEWRAQMPAEPDFVLNSVSSGGGGVVGYQRSYVAGFEAVLNWGRTAARSPALVYTSSTSVYPQDGGVRVDERASTSASDPRTQILLDAEALARSWPGSWTVLRLAGIYGPGRHHLLDALRAGAATQTGRGEHRLNLIHRDDAVEAIVAAFASPDRAGGEIFNVADDGAAPKAEVVGWLATRIGRDMPSFTGVSAPGRRTITPDRIIDNTKLKRVLDWRPRYPSYREGYAGLA